MSEMIADRVPLVEGIQTIGVGKRGSDDCSPALIYEIQQQIGSADYDPCQLGAFLGALWIKGATVEEQSLNTAFATPVIESSQAAADFVLQNMVSSLQKQLARDLLVELLSKNTLTAERMNLLGGFLFSEDFPIMAKAMVASAMRVRYIEPHEYYGLAQAIGKTYHPAFIREKDLVQKGLVQIADPFDGLTGSESITPIIAHYLQNQGLRVVQMVGNSAGPKFGFNGADFAQALQVPKLKHIRDASSSAFGSVIHQDDLSLALAEWVGIRKRMLKRPFLATLERFLNPMGAEVLFVSAFHATFTDKMVEIGEYMGFTKIAVFFKSVEGHLGLSLGRTTEVQISMRNEDQSYTRKELFYTPEMYGFQRTADPKGNNVELGANINKIQRYIKNGGSGDTYFDNRAAYTLAVYRDILSKMAVIS